MSHCLNLQIGKELAMNSTDGGTGLKLSLAMQFVSGDMRDILWWYLGFEKFDGRRRVRKWMEYMVCQSDTKLHKKWSFS